MSHDGGRQARIWGLERQPFGLNLKTAVTPKIEE